MYGQFLPHIALTALTLGAFDPAVGAERLPDSHPGMNLAFQRVHHRIEDSFSNLQQAFETERKANEDDGWTQDMDRLIAKIREDYEALHDDFTAADANVKEGFDLDWRRLARKAYEAEIEIMGPANGIDETERENIRRALDELEEKINFLRGRIFWEGLFVF